MVLHSPMCSRELIPPPKCFISYNSTCLKLLFLLQHSELRQQCCDTISPCIYTCSIAMNRTVININIKELMRDKATFPHQYCSITSCNAVIVLNPKWCSAGRLSVENRIGLWMMRKVSISIYFWDLTGPEDVILEFFGVLLSWNIGKRICFKIAF